VDRLCRPFRAWFLSAFYPGRRCALPWAILSRPFGAKKNDEVCSRSMQAIHTVLSYSHGLKGHDMTAQGNALGKEKTNHSFSSAARRVCEHPPPSGGDVVAVGTSAMVFYMACSAFDVSFILPVVCFTPCFDRTRIFQIPVRVRSRFVRKL
jgi:hypothetical protein